MNTVNKRAFLSHFEMACEFAILIVLADMTWLVHDIISNGLNVWYVFIMLGMLVGLVGTVKVLYNHHVRYVHRFIKNRRIKAIQHNELN